MDPITDFFEAYPSESEKVAWEVPETLKSFGRSVGHAGMSAGAAAVVGTALTGAAMGATAAYNALTKARDFRRMLEVNPDLNEHHQADPKMFNQMFTSLRTTVPQFSKDPLIAGSHMRRMMESKPEAGMILTQALSFRDKFPNLQETVLRGAVETASRGMQEHMKQQIDPSNSPDFFKNKLEKAKLEDQQTQFGQTHAQRENQFNASHKQRNDQFGQTHAQRENQFNAGNAQQDKAYAQREDQFNASHKQRNDQFGQTHAQRDKHFNAGNAQQDKAYAQRENQFNASHKQRNNQFRATYNQKNDHQAGFPYGANKP